MSTVVSYCTQWEHPITRNVSAKIEMRPAIFLAATYEFEKCQLAETTAVFDIIVSYQTLVLAHEFLFSNPRMIGISLPDTVIKCFFRLIVKIKVTKNHSFILSGK